MEFACSLCNYSSCKKENVTRHINKKIPCGIGKRELVEIPIDIICEYCNKNFSTSTSLFKHQKSHCPNKLKILEDEIENLKKQLQEKSVVNNTYNDNRTVNITINYIDTKPNLPDKLCNKLLTDTDFHKIVPALVKYIHFNSKTPENHNIYISNRNKNNKHLQIFNEGHWETVNKDTEIDNLINDKETILSDWVVEKGEKYPNAHDKFNEYQEQKNEESIAKLIKEEVELVLYNNKHMINK
jgi:hypothetical protein